MKFWEDKAVRRVLLGVALIALLHSALWFAHYNQTALGESPALDSRQTLELARAMAEGMLAEEPFHRAPLYPYLLSVFLSLGLPYELLPLVARWLNAFALAITAASASWIALRLWGRPACGWAAGLLVALNPVLLFFAGDAFDILLATVPLMLAIALLQTWFRQPSLRLTLLIGMLLALGGALRSHLLPLALLWPLAACCLGQPKRFTHAGLAALPVVVSLLLLGLANIQVGGEFRVTPWQSAYNLWAGNSPDASGRIYSQRIRVDFGTTYDNPAKLESIALYESATGEIAPHSIDAMNSYWRQQFFDHIQQEPTQWLGLMLRKAYYFLNSYEQYDNKTYGFHKQQHPLLQWNPIHWGALLLLAVAGALIGLRQPSTRPLVIAFILLFGLYALGTILFYTPNRFRVPMVPVLAILASALPLLPRAWKQSASRWRIVFVLCLLTTLSITYSGLFDARNTDTWEEDHALLANASLRTGRDDDAIRHANAALGMNPERADMHAVQAQAHFNRWALSGEPKSISPEQAEELLQLTRLGSADEPQLKAVVGIYQWKLGQNKTALATWGSVATTNALARLCLIRTGRSTPPEELELARYQEDPSFPLLLALSRPEHSPADSQAVARFIDAILQAVEGEGMNEARR